MQGTETKDKERGAIMKGKKGGNDRERLFSDQQFGSVGVAVRAGILVGCLISCVMLVASIAMGVLHGIMNDGMVYCLSLILAGVAGGVLQQLWFNLEATMLRLRYPTRLLGFAMSYYACLVGCALLGHWVPPIVEAWVGFTVIFLAILLVLTIVFSWMLRRRGLEYDHKLKEYQVRHK